MFPFSLSAADVGVVILDETTSKGSVPSKSYNLMSYGIPSLYIASKDSQLNDYIQEFGHGACFAKSELNKAVAFLEKAAHDDLYHNKLSQNSLKGAENFKRSNANKFIKNYLK